MMINIRKQETELWEAADLLRADSFIFGGNTYCYNCGKSIYNGMKKCPYCEIHEQMLKFSEKPLTLGSKAARGC